MSVKEHKLKQDLLYEYFGQVTPPPAEIFYLGDNLEVLLHQPRVGIVGSRKPTPYGKAITESIASELSRQGVILVSGLALGIDSIAHTIAVTNSQPTIAVLPCGLDTVYPRTNRLLAQQILDCGGLLISEYPHKTDSRKEHFIARNRLIAALSHAVVIPEATEKSGSLYTARFAWQQNVPVMAVPGPLTSHLSKGTNKLIQSGAKLILGVDDILHTLGLNKIRQKQLCTDSETEQIILKLITNGIQDGTEILRHSNMTPETFNQTITILEITGRIKSIGVNQWIIVE